MFGFIEGCDRRQQLFLPDCIDDYVAGDSPVRIVDVFLDELDLAMLGFAGAAATGRPGYHPATLLKLYICGSIIQVQSSGRLERCPLGARDRGLVSTERILLRAAGV